MMAEEKRPVIVGAVLYDPKVSIIWDIISDFFNEKGCPIDVVLYTNYELQVKALMDGHVDMVWNSPLAWLDAQRLSNKTCRAIAMRDTDRDRISHFIVKKDSDINSLEDLKGKKIALGAKDSPQATLIPLQHLSQNGLEAGNDFEYERFDKLVGKHGDHVGGELDAFKSLEKGESDASVMLDLNWETWTADGTISTEKYKILESTEKFDHCVFAVREDFPKDLEKKWLDVLFSMSYDNPDHKKMMDMEGLKEWKEGRTSGFGPLTKATELLNFFNEN